jgi:hypothetical protein
METVIVDSLSEYGELIKAKAEIEVRIGSLIHRIFEPKWHLDLFSTILSRKHSYHKRCGKLMYVKTKKEQKQ